MKRFNLVMLGGVLTPVFAADGTLVLAAELEAAESRIAELEKPMANKLDGTTHWETCATEGGRHHYNCAVARIAELEAHVAELKAALRCPEHRGGEHITADTVRRRSTPRVRKNQ